ncbi:RNA helicase-like protein [Candidatus Symbiobacter mobilis CR]|uniref:RNA helicase-like protein n=1 Tax=Candidatus Symbiobacter mobilis CR TaxID=946483 RepID=U5N802_9BURK|nr:RNA helicase-like protein [Candidatus Symbiobacter mobilis CR]
MLPSLLARSIQFGLTQFLVSAFEPADAFSHGLMSRFVHDEEEAWCKGPFVQVGLPFRTYSSRGCAIALHAAAVLGILMYCTYIPVPALRCRAHCFGSPAY